MGYITNLSRELRKNPTEAESFLWQSLRKKNRSGSKFLRQYPLIVNSIQGKTEFFIADFFCAASKLVIEVDGGYHNAPYQKEDDNTRDKICKDMGLRVLRFTNEEVLNDVSAVLKRIDEALADTP